MTTPTPYIVEFDPIALSLGPLQIHWYALAYLAGFIFGWWYIKYLARKLNMAITPQQIDDFLTWAIAGVLLGGRLGYVLFYMPGYYLQHPLEIFALWQGGMSFHGGLIGIIAATILFARKYKIAIFTLGDLVAAAGPIGLGLGRLSNFINGELYGRTTDAPIGMIFPRAGDNLPRHPSQLYEAGLEGIALFFIIFNLMRFTSISRYPGVIGGIFLSGYGLARFSIEFFREPDAQLGFLFAGATMGQLLSLPMIFSGLCIIIWALKYKAHQK